jgi:hemerythrin-like domain-containing protein
LPFAAPGVTIIGVRVRAPACQGHADARRPRRRARIATDRPMTASTSLDLLHDGPAAGFDQPFEMLEACHGRVERMLRLLERLAAHLALHGADAQARSAAADVTRYFDLAGPAHHEDEERHVLPRLRAGGDPAQVVLAARLHADHAQMTLAWSALRADLARVLGGDWRVGETAPPAWNAFATLYREHIAAEEGQAYPAVRENLNQELLRQMGREMAARRGAKEPT